MKKQWVRPLTEIERFVANEYVAACGESGTVYKFTCDAGYVEAMHNPGFCGCGDYHSILSPTPDGVYLKKESWYVRDENGNSLMNGYASYSPCGTEHEAESDGDFIIGYMDNLSTPTKESIKVMTWAGPNNNNIHCTTKLDMNTWETAKS